MNNLTRATNENGSVYVGYDNRYRVSSFSDPFYYGISYNYDTVGNRTKLKLNGTTYATYTYDAANRLTNLADSANQNFPHAYDGVNRLTTRSAPNGVTTNYAYDGLNRLTALTHMAGANTLIGNQYTYNDANNISSWTNVSGNHAYGYDLVDRLTSASNSVEPNESYSYDGIGNRTASHLSSSYGYQLFNELTSTATASYTYDNNGNLLSKTDSLGTTTFTWNEEKQLTQVSRPGGLTVNYKYDGLGRRIQRTTTAGPNERYVYDGANVLLDLNADWSVATTYLNGTDVDNHLRQSSALTGVSYYLTDHLGSTAGLTDSTGTVLEQLSYDSFGNNSGSSRTRYAYTGRERDPDTGQLYYRARFYDPQLGRFLSEDPISFGGGDVNFYAYVKNRSLLLRDPSGLRRCDPVVGAILGAGGGGVAGVIGGALLGPWVGGVLGAATLGSVGTIVEPGGGTAVGGGGGAVAGAAAGAIAGPYVGGGIGAGIGAYIGYKYCSGDDACDKPRVLPFPKTEPIPVPPPKDEDDCRMRLVQCLRFAGTDPKRSEECMKAYKDCLQKLK